MNNLYSPGNINQIVWTVMYLFVLTNSLSSWPAMIFFPLVFGVFIEVLELTFHTKC